MWKSKFMDDCFVIINTFINTKNKSDFFLIWIILVFLLEQDFSITELHISSNSSKSHAYLWHDQI